MTILQDWADSVPLVSNGVNTTNMPFTKSLVNGDIITLTAGSSVDFGAAPVITGINGFGVGNIESQAEGEAFYGGETDMYGTKWHAEYNDVDRRSVARVDGLKVTRSMLGRNDPQSGAGLLGIDMGSELLGGEKFMMSSWVKATYSGDISNCQWKTYRVKPDGGTATLSENASFYTKTFIQANGTHSSEVDMYRPESKVYYDQQHLNHPTFDSKWTRQDLFCIMPDKGVANGTIYTRGLKEGQIGVKRSFVGSSNEPKTGNGDLLMSDANSLNYRWLFEQEFVNNSTEVVTWVDSVEILRRERYYQKGWARIELAESDQENLMILPEIQPYITWANGVITIKLFKGLMSDFNNKVVVVYDENDQIIATAPLTASNLTLEAVV